MSSKILRHGEMDFELVSDTTPNSSFTVGHDVSLAGSHDSQHIVVGEVLHKKVSEREQRIRLLSPTLIRHAARHPDGNLPATPEGFSLKIVTARTADGLVED